MTAYAGCLVQPRTGFQREVGHSVDAVNMLGIEPVGHLLGGKAGHALRGAEAFEFCKGHAEEIHLCHYDIVTDFTSKMPVLFKCYEQGARGP